MEPLATADLAKILLAIILGATGTYLLLPHRHDRARPRLGYRLGLGFATLSVLCLVLLCDAGGVELIGQAFFYLFAFTAVGGGILTVISRDPIHNALWFASVILSTTGLFLLSGAQFLAAGTVIVYAGAIIVTFLFVLMLAQKEGRAVYDRMARAPFWATFASFLMLFGLVYALVSVRGSSSTVPRRDAQGMPALGMIGVKVHPAQARLVGRPPMTPTHAMILERSLPATSRLPEATGNGQAFDRHVAGLGGTLYSEHLVTVELAGGLLFVALIGALAIASPRPPIRPSTGDASTATTAATASRA